MKWDRERKERGREDTWELPPSRSHFVNDLVSHSHTVCPPTTPSQIPIHTPPRTLPRPPYTTPHPAYLTVPHPFLLHTLLYLLILSCNTFPYIILLYTSTLFKLRCSHFPSAVCTNTLDLIIYTAFPHQPSNSTLLYPTIPCPAPFPSHHPQP